MFPRAECVRNEYDTNIQYWKVHPFTSRPILYTLLSNILTTDDRARDRISLSCQVSLWSIAIFLPCHNSDTALSHVIFNYASERSIIYQRNNIYIYFSNHPNKICLVLFVASLLAKLRKNFAGIIMFWYRLAVFFCWQCSCHFVTENDDCYRLFDKRPTVNLIAVAFGMNFFLKYPNLYERNYSLAIESIFFVTTFESFARKMFRAAILSPATNRTRASWNTILSSERLYIYGFWFSL